MNKYISAEIETSIKIIDATLRPEKKPLEKLFVLQDVLR